MNKLVVFTFMTVLLANIFTTSAWAGPCLHDAGNGKAQEMGGSVNTDMPCHEQDNHTVTDSYHCEGVCLCLHASFQQTPISAGLTLANAKTEKTLIRSFQDDLTSISILPPRRPPKYLS